MQRGPSSHRPASHQGRTDSPQTEHRQEGRLTPYRAQYGLDTRISFSAAQLPQSICQSTSACHLHLQACSISADTRKVLVSTFIFSLEESNPFSVVQLLPRRTSLQFTRVPISPANRRERRKFSKGPGTVKCVFAAKHARLSLVQPGNPTATGRTWHADILGFPKLVNPGVVA